jgi:hypothetical protein
MDDEWILENQYCSLDAFDKIPIDSGSIFPFAGSVLVSGREQLLL